MAFVLGATALGTGALTSTLVRYPPIVSVTAPTGTVTTPTISGIWTYDSEISRPQEAFRLVLESNSETLFDTGLLAGDDSTFALGYPLSPFSTYRLWVGVNDGLDGAEDPYSVGDSWGSTEFSTSDLTVVHPTNTQVGSFYEVAINGQGYMLADEPGGSSIRRQTAHLDVERLVTGETPHEQAIDRYAFISHQDWTGGEGQLFLRRPRSDGSRFWYSEWVNPFESGQLSLVDDPELHIADVFAHNAAGQKAVVAGGSVYVQTDTSELTALDVPGGTPTTFPMFHTGLQDMASDGEFWYVTTGANIERNNTAATPGGAWSTVDADEIEWCTDRIAYLHDDVFGTLSPAGADENGGAGWQTFTGAGLQGLCGGDGHIWFGVNYGITGHIRAWPLSGGAGDSFIALTLPEGEKVDNLFFYLGNVFVSTFVDAPPPGEANARKVYRCVTSQGLLTPQLVATIPDFSADYRVMFSGRDRFVAFSWRAMVRTGESGFAVYDLETDGFARWQAGATGDQVVGLVNWAGDFGFLFRQTGFYGKAETPAPHDGGFLETSVDDLSSNVAKRLVQLQLSSKPLNGTIEVSISTDSNETFASVGTMLGVGVTTHEVDLALEVNSVGLRFTLSPAGGVGPVLLRNTTRLHALGLADQLVTLPIRCADRLKGLQGGELPESRPGLAMIQIRVLESLVGQTVSFQDVDYPRTGAVYRAQVTALQVEELVGVTDVNQALRVNSGVAQLTLRRKVR